jgi:hypothetical protein
MLCLAFCRSRQVDVALALLQEKRFLAEYDKEVREFELEHPEVASGAAAPANSKREVPKHPKVRPRTLAQAQLLRNRDLVMQGPKVIAVHCTHGFNRSGYCLVHYAKRMCPSLSVAECLRQCAALTAAYITDLALHSPWVLHPRIPSPEGMERGWKLLCPRYRPVFRVWGSRLSCPGVAADIDLLRRFAEARKPGIYKDEYIQALFEYHHEVRPEFGPHAVETPMVPAWKPERDDADELAADDAQPAMGGAR